MAKAEREYIVSCCQEMKPGEHKVFLGKIVEQAFPPISAGERMSEGYKRVVPATSSYSQFLAAINWSGIARFSIRQVPADGGSYEVYRYQ